MPQCVQNFMACVQGWYIPSETEERSTLSNSMNIGRGWAGAGTTLETMDLYKQKFVPGKGLNKHNFEFYLNICALRTRCPGEDPESSGFQPPSGPTRTVTRVEAQDEEGKAAVVDIMVFINGYSWQCNSSETIELRGRPIDILQDLNDDDMQPYLLNAHALIALGVASEEGLTGQEQLARDRSTQLQRLLKLAKNSPRRLYTLTLGQHATRRTEGRGVPYGRETEDQRAVVVLAVMDEEEGSDLEQALRSRLLAGVAGFPFDLTQYPKFTFTSVR